MQGRGRAYSQSAMSKVDDNADRRPPQAGASITCLALPKAQGFDKEDVDPSADCSSY